jgi:Holliday junction DNA helicase RuvA
MIDYLRGQIQHTEVDFIVIEVHGIGYRVFCANPYSFPSQAEVVVFIHHHVREDAILLYGFSTREEQSLFRRLLEVSGIGPRVAIGVLSGGKPEMLVSAIQREDLAYLTRLPGIGKKTAQRMILDLKDKLGASDSPYRDASAIGTASHSAEIAGAGSELHEAKEGLMALGFSEAEIDRVWPAVKAAVKEGDKAEVFMKLALQQLYKG